MKTTRPARAAILIACALLAGCVGPGPTPRPAATDQARPRAVGTYKVGQPYQIDGIYYYPREDYHYVETGIASWYGPNFHGRLTANGERFDMNDLTAAHRTLPMPSSVRITNLDNGRSLVLRVNDRGPFAHGRIIDVSRRSAQLLGFHHRGTARVRVEIVADESRRLAMLARRGMLDDSERISPAPAPAPVIRTEPLPPLGEPTRLAAATDAAEPGGGPSAADPEPAAARPRAPVVEFRPVRPTSLYVQAGAFVQYINAARLRTELEHYARARVTEARVGRERFFRVRLGPLPSVEAADLLLNRVMASGYPGARLIVE